MYVWLDLITFLSLRNFGILVQAIVVVCHKYFDKYGWKVWWDLISGDWYCMEALSLNQRFNSGTMAEPVTCFYVLFILILDCISALDCFIVSFSVYELGFLIFNFSVQLHVYNIVRMMYFSLSYTPVCDLHPIFDCILSSRYILDLLLRFAWGFSLLDFISSVIIHHHCFYLRDWSFHDHLCMRQSNASFW